MRSFPSWWTVPTESLWEVSFFVLSLYLELRPEGPGLGVLRDLPSVRTQKEGTALSSPRLRCSTTSPTMSRTVPVSFVSDFPPRVGSLGRRDEPPVTLNSPTYSVLVPLTPEGLGVISPVRPGLKTLESSFLVIRCMCRQGDINEKE